VSGCAAKTSVGTPVSLTTAWCWASPSQASRSLPRGFPSRVRPVPGGPRRAVAVAHGPDREGPVRLECPGHMDLCAVTSSAPGRSRTYDTRFRSTAQADVRVRRRTSTQVRIRCRTDLDPSEDRRPRDGRAMEVPRRSELPADPSVGVPEADDLVCDSTPSMVGIEVSGGDPLAEESLDDLTPSLLRSWLSTLVIIAYGFGAMYWYTSTHGLNFWRGAPWGVSFFVLWWVIVVQAPIYIGRWRAARRTEQNG